MAPELQEQRDAPCEWQGRSKCGVLKVVFKLCLLGPAQQGCQEFGSRDRGSLHRGQSGTSCRRLSAGRLFSIQIMYLRVTELVGC